MPTVSENKVKETKSRFSIDSIRDNLLVDIVIAFLAIISVLLLFFEVFAGLHFEQEEFIRNVDLVIALIFLTEFIVSLSLAKDKLLHFKKNWTDLIASIPITTEFSSFLRALRLLRLLHLFRVIRFIARVKAIGSIAERLRPASSMYVYSSVIGGMVILTIFIFGYIFWHIPNMTTIA